MRGVLSYPCVRSTRSTQSLGRFTGSTIDLDPLQSMISEIKGEKTREQELTHCQPRFAEGNVRLQAAFEKLKGNEKGESKKEKKKKQHRIRPQSVARERNPSSSKDLLRLVSLSFWGEPEREAASLKGHGAAAAGQSCFWTFCKKENKKLLGHISIFILTKEFLINCFANSSTQTAAPTSDDRLGSHVCNSRKRHLQLSLYARRERRTLTLIHEAAWSSNRAKRQPLISLT